ncbi:unnamed protein product [Lactuca saligna]|uniref:Uncharacterized protein n=1 Tax=Lactuca saligna TaxID=75948 RepID=A0AA35ZJE4_LACSI|nr:unnamed protein product [Lactuca saligna]CAI9293222.1 unnamed protein product [Lactuca saligna]
MGAVKSENPPPNAQINHLTIDAGFVRQFFAITERPHPLPYPPSLTTTSHRKSEFRTCCSDPKILPMSTGIDSFDIFFCRVLDIQNTLRSIFNASTFGVLVPTNMKVGFGVVWDLFGAVCSSRHSTTVGFENTNMHQ